MLPTTGNTQNTAGLALRDYNPVLLPYLIPTQPQIHTIGLSAQASLNTVNIHYREHIGDEKIHIDTETNILNLSLNYRQGPWRLQFTLPYISHDSGIFDSAIYRYHDLLGFHEGTRDPNKNNQRVFSYQRGGQAQLDTQGYHGFGNPSLSAGYLFPSQRSSVWLSYKPAIRHQPLIAHRSHDLAIWLHHQHIISDTLAVYGHLGKSFLSTAGTLKPWQRRHIWFGNIGTEYQWKPRWAITGQIDFHQAVIHSELPYFADSVQLALGLSHTIGDRKKWQLAFSEDIQKDSAPDIGLHFSFSF